MIKVNVTIQNDKIHALLVSGHANSGEYGKDLVCAAVSAVVIGGLNAIQCHADYAIKIDDGYVSLEAKSLPNGHDQIVLETIVTGLLTIEQNYRKYIKIKQERTDNNE